MNNKYSKKILKNNGFTLIEVLVVIGIIAILAAVVLVAVNPGRQFALARNSQRTSNIAAILNAISQNMIDHQGKFICNGQNMFIGEPKLTISTDHHNIRGCLVPDYLSEVPLDPVVGKIEANSYNTGYTLSQDSVTKRITISAPEAELGQTIEITR